ncbi:MAG: PA14 domain-containing protein [Phycisphaerae bacterium]
MGSDVGLARRRIGRDRRDRHHRRPEFPRRSSRQPCRPPHVRAGRALACREGVARVRGAIRVLRGRVQERAGARERHVRRRRNLRRPRPLPTHRDLNFAFRFRGTFEAPVDGVYRFSLGSDDGSMLLVDGTQAVDNDKPHSFLERRGVMALAKGVHEFEVMFFENSGGFVLKADIEGPGMARRPLCDGK